MKKQHSLTPITEEAQTAYKIVSKFPRGATIYEIELGEKLYSLYPILELGKYLLKQNSEGFKKPYYEIDN
jgi:hypothetical protein